MKRKCFSTPASKQRGHLKHIAMMAMCCGLPILLLISVAAYGINSQSLEFLILLICPIGMGLMIWMMMRDRESPEVGADKTDPLVGDEEFKRDTSSS